MEKDRFIPREKLGKKARKALDREGRATWGIRPVTRRVQSGKLYDRKKRPHDRYDDGMGPFRARESSMECHGSCVDKAPRAG